MYHVIMKISKTIQFDAAHQLPNSPCYGACRNLHGHTYKLETIVEGEINEKGWIMNFKDLKKILIRITKKYDHSFLNDYFKIPTAEIMVREITEDLGEALVSYNLISITCRLWETQDSYAEYTLSLH